MSLLLYTRIIVIFSFLKACCLTGQFTELLTSAEDKQILFI